MTALARVLDKTRGEGRAALVGYLPVGYPDVATSVRAMTALVEAGADGLVRDLADYDRAFGLEGREVS